MKILVLRITKKNDKKMMYKNTEISESENNIKEYRQRYGDTNPEGVEKEYQQKNREVTKEKLDERYNQKGQRNHKPT